MSKLDQMLSKLLMKLSSLVQQVLDSTILPVAMKASLSPAISQL